MIYAVISDVHGNYPAFRAVIEDAKAKSAEAFATGRLYPRYTNP